MCEHYKESKRSKGKCHFCGRENVEGLLFLNPKTQAHSLECWECHHQHWGYGD